MTATEELLRRAERYAERAPAGETPARPAKQVAVVTCMDARIDLSSLLGLREGDAHVIRNAGGVVTDDVIRSLAISQRLLGTEEVMLIHHTGCGMLTFTDDEFRLQLERDTGLTPSWAAEAFGDLADDVRASIARVKSCPFVPHRDKVRGFIYDLSTRHLNEVK